MSRKLLLLRLMLMNGFKRAEYLKKKKYFHKQGDNCYFQPYNFGTEPHLIEFGDNVNIASGVRFVNHDIISFVFNNMDEVTEKKIPTKVDKIVIGNNVFLGCNSVILPGVIIGDNVIIGAGSVVNKDIPSGSVAAGMPCKVIGEFESFKKQYIEEVRQYTWEADDEAKTAKQIKYFW